MEQCNLKTKPEIKAILIAEDDEDDVFLFKEALVEINKDIDITVVSDGLTAISALKKSVKADIVFLDVNMPRMNGLECLIEIKNISETIPVIILTTSKNEDLIEQAQALGASGFISKPSNFYQYQKVMNEVFAMNWNDQPLFYLRTD